MPLDIQSAQLSRYLVKGQGYYEHLLRTVARAHRIDIDRPFEQLNEKQQALLLSGTGARKSYQVEIKKSRSSATEISAPDSTNPATAVRRLEDASTRESLTVRGRELAEQRPPRAYVTPVACRPSSRRLPSCRPVTISRAGRSLTLASGRAAAVTIACGSMP